jgi:uncharacterized protein YbjQ (UPF0145 family)
VQHFTSRDRDARLGAHRVLQEELVSDMIVSTMNDLPGFKVDEVIGEVTGLTVRSRNVGTQIGAGFKSLVGGELKGLTKQLQESRDEARERLVEAAQEVGANAVLAMRFDSDEVGNGYQELVAYGTAVKVSPA